jgi:hypothetical protein
MTAPSGRRIDEPLLDVDEIQGNILPGFMKPYMRLISLKFGDIAQGRAFLASRSVTSLADVMGSRRKVRAARTLQPSLRELGATPDGVDDLWLNVALSYRGLTKLADESPTARRNSTRSATRRSSLASPPAQPVWATRSIKRQRETPHTG